MVQIKYTPLRQSDFASGGVFCQDNKRYYSKLLSLSFRILFGREDYTSISRSEIIKLNKLLKGCFYLIESEFPDDIANINTITVFPYLSRAILQMGCRKHLPEELINKHRQSEPYIKNSTSVRMSDLSPTWIPKSLKVYLRRFFKKDFEFIESKNPIYPEVLYSALVLYICRELAVSCVSVKQIRILTNEFLHVLTKNEIETRAHHQATGKHRQKNTNFDELYKWFVDEYDRGRYDDCSSILQLKDRIRTDFGLSPQKASEFVKRLKLERGQNILRFKKGFK